MALEVGDYPYVDFEEALWSGRQAESLVLAPDQLQDPQNPGSLLRSAEAAGVDRCSSRNAGRWGHRRRLCLGRCSRAPESSHRSSPALRQMQGAAFRPRAERPYQPPLPSGRITGRVVLVVGSEGEGLRRLTRETCDVLIELPMRGRVTSLNAAVAGAIVLFEALRQRSVE